MLICCMFIKRASKRNILHCHNKVSFFTMDITGLWLAGPNNTEKITKNRNYLGGPSVRGYILTYYGLSGEFSTRPLSGELSTL